MNIAALADLLHETSERHGSFEAVAPPHDWWDWYGLAAHPIGDGRLADRQAVSDDGQDCVISLFHFADLHEHSAHLLAL